MRTCLALVVSVCVVFSCASCTMHEKKIEQELKHYPINCATAEGDIRALQHEKAHVQDQMLAGVSSITPAGAVVGFVTGKEGENLSVTTGDYNEKIDARIAEIKAECGLR